MKRNTTTVVEITDYHVKLLQARSVKGKVRLVTCDTEPIKSNTEEHLSHLLKKIVFRHVVEPKNLSFILSRNLVMFKRLRIPSINEKEIDKMVALQLVNEVPYPMQDVVHDHFILDKEESGYATVLCVVVHKEIVERYLALFRKIEVPLSRLTFSSLGIVQWYYFLGVAEQIADEASFLLISIDAGHSELCFCRKKKMYYSRSIGFGAMDLSQTGLPVFLKQIRLTWHAYREEGLGTEVKHFVILSDMDEAERLKKAIEDEFDLPCEHVSCGENISPIALPGVFKAQTYKTLSLSAALGYLVAPPAKILNFIPQEVYDTKLRMQKKRQIIKFILLMLSIFVLIVGTIGIDILDKSRIIRSLNRQLEETRSDARQAKDYVQMAELTQSDLDKQVVASDVIFALIKLVPIEISLRTLNLTSDGMLNIKGYAKTSMSLNNFQEQLVKSSLFDNVYRRFSRKRKIARMELLDFEIETRVKSVEEWDYRGLLK